MAGARMINWYVLINNLFGGGIALFFIGAGIVFVIIGVRLLLMLF